MHCGFDFGQLRRGEICDILRKSSLIVVYCAVLSSFLSWFRYHLLIGPPATRCLELLSCIFRPCDVELLELVLINRLLVRLVMSTGKRSSRTRVFELSARLSRVMVVAVCVKIKDSSYLVLFFCSLFSFYCGWVRIACFIVVVIIIVVTFRFKALITDYVLR